MKENVFIARCLSYDQKSILKHIRRIIDWHGGASALIKPGQTVLLKPNMLSCKTPDKAATTHPAIVQAVAQIFKEANARVLIGDSPPAVFGRADTYWQTTGFAEAAKNSGAELISFESMAKTELSIFTNGENKKVHVVKALFDADLVVNLPKLKTHNLTRITAAVKNLFGLVPGFQKAQWHKIYPKSVEFSNFITDLAIKLPTQLTILDAVEGMDGQGPAGGRKVFPGFILSSKNPVAIDRAICAATGIDEDSVAMLRRAKQLKWGPESVEEIEFAGDSLSSIMVKDFNAPGRPLQDRIPSMIIDKLKKLVWAGPVLKKGLCVKCGRCAEICPVKAINITENGAEFDRKLCISCFCCMEVCPVDAIEAEKSPLVKVGMRLRNLKKTLRRKN